MPEPGDPLVPLSDEQAKLLQEALKALRDVGDLLRDILGTVPEDLVGYLGGDWLKVRRAENVAQSSAVAVFTERRQIRAINRYSSGARQRRYLATRASQIDGALVGLPAQ